MALIEELRVQRGPQYFSSARKESGSHRSEVDVGMAESHLLGIKGGGKFKMEQGETISNAC